MIYLCFGAINNYMIIVHIKSIKCDCNGELSVHLLYENALPTIQDYPKKEAFANEKWTNYCNKMPCLLAMVNKFLCTP